jgi:ribonuclease HII
MKQAAIGSRPSLKTERRLAALRNGAIAGVDEAGRGPWAGPVVAAAVLFRSARHIPDGLDDSKRLRPERREELWVEIRETATIGVSVVPVEEIDRINIFQATMRAMAEAVAQLGGAPEVVLVDGNRAPPLTQRTVTVVEGDRLCPSIAAASIIAKVTRDRLMCQLADGFPLYGWQNNKGYGTQAHAEAILAHGVTTHHRRSFAPIRAAMEGRDVPISPAMSPD